MIGSRDAVQFVGALAIVGVSGCFANLANDLENAFEDLELSEPLEADVQVEGVERGAVRAGLFAQTAAAEVVAADDTTTSGEVDLQVDWADGGRIDAYLPSDASSVSVQPLQDATMQGEGVVFTLPELSADTSLVAIVWYDDDGDGALDLSVDGASESARTIARDHEGTPHYLSSYSYDAAEDTYSATAVADVDGTASNVVLTRDQLSDWTVMIDRATDDPG
jgi:hypothetical protein